MRKIPIVVLLSIGMVSVLWLMRPGPASADVQEGRGGPAGQTPFAGTFLVEYDYGPFGTLLAMVQIHGDGTYWATNQSDFGLDGTLNSPNVGSWRRTGPHQTTGVKLTFAFDVDGQPTAVVRLTDVTDWDVGFNTASTVSTLRWYELGEDPLDPEQGTHYAEVPCELRRLVP